MNPRCLEMTAHAVVVVFDGKDGFLSLHEVEDEELTSGKKNLEMQIYKFTRKRKKATR